MDRQFITYSGWPKIFYDHPHSLLTFLTGFDCAPTLHSSGAWWSTRHVEPTTLPACFEFCRYDSFFAFSLQKAIWFRRAHRWASIRRERRDQLFLRTYNIAILDLLGATDKVNVQVGGSGCNVWKRSSAPSRSRDPGSGYGGTKYHEELCWLCEWGRRWRQHAVVEDLKGYSVFVSRF